MLKKVFHISNDKFDKFSILRAGSNPDNHVNSALGIWFLPNL